MTNDIQDLTKVEQNLGIEFNNRGLLLNALTHRSYLNEVKTGNISSNERLEFLGDSVLSFWVSGNIYKKFPDFPEGKLTFIRTHLVRTETLAELSKKLQVGNYLLMSRGEEMGGGRENPLLLANSFEAILGAIYLDKGIEAVSSFLNKQLGPVLALVKNPNDLKDSKSLLQEKVQAEGFSSPVYKLHSSEGPDHAKTFTMGVYVGDKLLAEGISNSKQQAEEEAAKKALENLPVEILSSMK